MDEKTLKSTIAGLIARVEALQSENTELRGKNAACAQAVSKLVTKVENLQAQNQELRVALRPVEYRQRPPVMRGRTVQSNVGCGPLYITLNEDERGRPFEVFFKLGKSGSCQQSYLEALGVAMSVGLRYGADPQKFVEKFEAMRCPNPKMRDANGPTTLSCADGISQGLAKALALALPLADVNPRAEADVVAVAEPRVTYSREEQAEIEANHRSIDLIAHPATSNGNGNGYSNGGSQMQMIATMQELPSPNIRKAMMTGVGMCPKCGGNLISQGGCIQCLQQCGYVGKCS
jgi:ribonucleoside-diphosphate reductase alpha chain